MDECFMPHLAGAPKRLRCLGRTQLVGLLCRALDHDKHNTLYVTMRLTSGHVTVLLAVHSIPRHYHL